MTCLMHALGDTQMKPPVGRSIHIRGGAYSIDILRTTLRTFVLELAGPRPNTQQTWILTDWQKTWETALEWLPNEALFRSKDWGISPAYRRGEAWR